jgi:nucleoside 2-deoxyribosyltransferase
MINKKVETKKSEIYLASLFFSKNQIERVKRVEATLEVNPFIETYFSPRQNQLDELPFGSKGWRKAVFAQDIKCLEGANVVVAITDMDAVMDYTYFDAKKNDWSTDTTEGPVDTDSGTAFEIGYA